MMKIHKNNKNFHLDVGGNPVTQVIQSVGVTDSSGNPVTGNIFTA